MRRDEHELIHNFNDLPEIEPRAKHTRLFFYPAAHSIRQNLNFDRPHHLAIAPAFSPPNARLAAGVAIDLDSIDRGPDRCRQSTHCISLVQLAGLSWNRTLLNRRHSSTRGDLT